MLQQSGVGNSTAWPPGITRCLLGESRGILLSEELYIDMNPLSAKVETFIQSKYIGDFSLSTKNI